MGAQLSKGGVAVEGKAAADPAAAKANGQENGHVKTNGDVSAKPDGEAAAADGNGTAEPAKEGEASAGDAIEPAPAAEGEAVKAEGEAPKDGKKKKNDPRTHTSQCRHLDKTRPNPHQLALVHPKQAELEYHSWAWTALKRTSALHPPRRAALSFETAHVEIPKKLVEVNKNTVKQWYKGRADDELVLQGINMLSRFPEAAEALRH
ncbi:MARCKS-related protein 1-A [Morone saxatilis]|uniref:MARCKS-related protein 1-A n=1 Tax=Morone saxatilis TaxID=34816 RepID=UPI0015E2131A|nr:MARCKS-related protein 1-A [Morone saxatilis]